MSAKNPRPGAPQHRRVAEMLAQRNARFAAPKAEQRTARKLPGHGHRVHGR